MSSAKRYNPDDINTDNIKHNLRYKFKGILLFLLPIPALIAAILSLVRGDILSTLITGGAFAAYMVAAMIARHGFKLEGEYHKHKIARAPKLPYKNISGILTSITTGLFAWMGADYGLFEAILLGGATLLGFIMYYGFDPRKDKHGNVSFGVSVEEVLDAMEHAEIRISAIEQARKKINDPQIHHSLGRITDKAREILTSIEDDPTRLSRARKFLKVYLDGAKRVTETYAKTHKSGTTTQALDTDFNQVLDSIEQTFTEQHTKLLENDNFDLDVQIEVLNRQLKREGVI